MCLWRVHNLSADCSSYQQRGRRRESQLCISWGFPRTEVAPHKLDLQSGFVIVRLFSLSLSLFFWNTKLRSRLGKNQAFWLGPLILCQKSHCMPLTSACSLAFAYTWLEYAKNKNEGRFYEKTALLSDDTVPRHVGLPVLAELGY